MKILITGGTGFIGQHLIRKRLQAGDEIYCLSRDPDKVERIFSGKVAALKALPDPEDFEVDAVVNLAGEPIVDKRWNEARKQVLRNSRIDLTTELVDWIAKLPVKPEVLVSGSAIGYFGSVEGGQKLGESADFTPGFTHDLCNDWEKAALSAESSGVRVCLIRTGVVLGHGGALSKMYYPFKMGLGGPVGSGKQWMSWIHIDDEVEVIEMLLTHSQLSGVFNLTSPNAATNGAFSKTLGRVMHRPAILPMPAYAMKLLLGEGAELLLEGQRVYPEKLLQVGYKFKYPDLEEALASICT
ncbi:TIGR01777 family oxidoreductase [Neptuniibacter sp.]|uniref:TIGR01777 family oxidoreductase n=1 Tax=Neptuniibacter sp. TaxID=1962643 RepID=UPI002602D804|nr:TIGR01777 family oxidoreductase [Neptuniibacter sp.]MCP4595576.1 TIGR01777 family protein [Neptuniibacter sp.]